MLGDWVHKVLTRLGFPECEGCKERREKLNRRDKQLRDLAKALNGMGKYYERHPKK